MVPVQDFGELAEGGVEGDLLELRVEARRDGARRLHFAAHHLHHQRPQRHHPLDQAGGGGGLRVIVFDSFLGGYSPR